MDTFNSTTWKMQVVLRKEGFYTMGNRPTIQWATWRAVLEFVLNVPRGPVEWKDSAVSSG